MNFKLARQFNTRLNGGFPFRVKDYLSIVLYYDAGKNVNQNIFLLL